MNYFPSLPVDAGVRHILQLNADAGRALVHLHTAALRNEGSLSAGDKELIAAYVSGLNACQYCYGVHSETARAFGVGDDVLTALMDDIDSAPVEARLKPLLHYARKLTLTPSKMTASDAQAVFDAGWRENEFHDAVLTISLFNFMNRLVEGHGIKGSAELFALRGPMLQSEGYDPLLKFLDQSPPVEDR